MSELIRKIAEAREIRRLCHFTPSRNLQHIAAGKMGVLSTAALSAAERAAYNATDLARYDGHRDHICCSIEFPNGWYFATARNNEPLFPDWVVLLLRPDSLWRDGTLFSPRNAAANGGRHLAPGAEAFEALFAETVSGSGGQVFRRTHHMREATPTDQQAEVLIPDRVPMDDIIGIAVVDENQARTEQARLRTNGIDPDIFTFVKAPYMFRKYDLSNVIQNGFLPNEEQVSYVRDLLGGAR